MNTLNSLEQRVFEQRPDLPSELFVIRSLYKVQMAFNPSRHDGTFGDIAVLAQTSKGSGYCCCFCEDPTLLPEWIGRDIRNLSIESASIRIAMLDAVYGGLESHPTYHATLCGSSDTKALARADILVAEIGLVAPGQTLVGTKVAVVGAVGSIISALQNAGAEVCATDLDEDVVDTVVGGVRVGHGDKRTIPNVRDCDVALITGMTLATGTFDIIVEEAKHSHTALLVFAQSGANFAPEYVSNGIDAVVAESFPNYIFPGDTQVRVFRAHPLNNGGL